MRQYCKDPLYKRITLAPVHGLLVTMAFVYACISNANAATAEPAITITYLKVAQSKQAGVPSYLLTASNSGVAGAEIAIADANITGRFLGYHYTLNLIDVPSFDEAVRLFENSDEENAPPASSSQRHRVASFYASPVILLDAPSSRYEAVMKRLATEVPNSLIINVSRGDPDLRNSYCDRLLLHTIPSFQMKTDALAQWFRVKRISNVLAIYGNHEQDTKFLRAFQTSAQKFKLNIVQTKQWQTSFDLRRAAFSEIPQFTRTRDDYDAVFTADTGQQFAYSLPFNTHRIVPVVGSAGLKPLGWHFTHEQWGARQLQNRFYAQFNRSMTEIDYAAYTAIIALSTAQQQKTPANGSALYQTLLSDDFTLAVYKGRPLSFRRATRQLRQPITLAHEEALVTHAPLAGFLHQSNELDTLGALNGTCKDTL